jgi:hypothetical protein
LAALTRFSFKEVGLSAEDFSVPGQIVFPPNRIDLLTEIDGVGFVEAWEARVESTYGDQPVFFISKEHLIRNKQAVGRPMDKADLVALRRATRKP